MKQSESLSLWYTIWWFIAIFGIPITFPWLIFQFISKIKLKHRKASLPGKVVLITGASSGLGEALAHTFYSCGCKLILVSRRKQELERVKNALLNTHHTIFTHVPVIHPLDLTEINSISVEINKILQIYGKIDILINNAGVSYRGEVIDTKIDVDIKVMLINYFGQIALTKAVLPSMIQQNFGCIVCISSVQGKIAIPFRSAYTSSKHALQAWCDSARAEISGKNIQITLVSPAYINTALSLNAITGSGENYGVMDEATKLGYSSTFVAEKILKAMLRGDKDVIIASFTQKIAILLRVLFPSLYFWIMQQRARKDIKAK